jgi:hypothetical protein
MLELQLKDYQESSFSQKNFLCSIYSHFFKARTFQKEKIFLSGLSKDQAYKKSW